MSSAELYVEHGRLVITIHVLAGTPLEAAWETVYKPPLFSLPSLTWSAVRTSGVLLLLGVGTLVCYRLYAQYSGRSAGGDDGDDVSWRGVLRRLLGVVTWETPSETIEDADDLSPSDHIQVHYFGPSEYYGPPLAPSAEPGWSSDLLRYRHLSEGSDSGSSASVSADSLPYQGDNSASASVGDQYRSDDEGDCSSLEPDMGNKTSKNYEPVFYNKDAGVIFNRLRADQLACPAAAAAGSADSSNTGSPLAAAAAPRSSSEKEPALKAPELRPVRKRVILPHGSRTASITSAESSQSTSASPRAKSLPPASPALAARRQQLRRQLQDASNQGGSVDVSVGELCRICKEGSIDSSTSDLSLDLAWADTLGSSTVDFLDQLESQLDVLKLDVTDMDSNLVTLHFPHKSAVGAASAGAGRRRLGQSISEYRLTRGNSLAGDEPASPAAAAAAGGGGEWPLLDSPATDGSLEWDSPEHGWSALPRASPGVRAMPPAARAGPPLSRSQSATSSLRRSPSLELRGEDMPSLEWDDTGVEQYPEVWADGLGIGDGAGLGDEMTALELDLELELGSSRDSASVRSLDSARVNVGEREGSVESSASTVQEHSSASRQGSLTLALSREESPATELLSESGYEGMDSSGVIVRTPLSPVLETATDRGPLSSDSALSVSADTLNGNMSHTSSACSARERRTNRDSAYWDDGLDTLAARALESVGEAMDLLQYADQEWRGGTPRAKTIRQGYEEMATKYQLTHIQRVRGDNYCAVRAALYQLLAKGLPPPNANRCRRLLDSAGDWVTSWSFGSRLPYDVASARSGIWECLSTLSQLSEELRQAGGAAGRQLRHRWNADPDLDLRCMEAVKLHMLAAAVQLEGQDQETAPLFSTLLFARDSSTTSRQLMMNHLNHVGDSGGLEQIEMFLLGHTLGVTLRVIRPSAHAQSDFVTLYPDERAASRAQLTLVAEDDRHYNVVS